MIEIEHNVPVPSSHNSKYPFAEMQVGDSFTVPNEQCASVAGSATNWGDRQTPAVRFTTRRIDEKSVRIWRIK